VKLPLAAKYCYSSYAIKVTFAARGRTVLKMDLRGIKRKVFINKELNSSPLSGGFELVIGLTMIKVRSGHERSAYADLQKRPEVRDIYRLFGEYTFFLVMQAEGRNRFQQILKGIKEENEVLKTGPILLTSEGDRADMTKVGA